MLSDSRAETIRAAGRFPRRRDDVGDLPAPEGLRLQSRSMELGTGSPGPACQNGHDIDWQALRRQLTSAIARICPSWLVEHRDDLVQTAILKVMKIESQREGETVWTPFYLSRLAHSALVDEIRHRRRRPEEPLGEEEDAEMPATQSTNPEQNSLGKELGRELRDCLKALVEARRRACTLHLLGHGTSEVARLLDWETKKTENAIYRGLADLRLCLEKKGLAP